MKYIDEEKLIAEIERRMKCYDRDGCEPNDGKWVELITMKHFIESLQQEQTEVDLEKEIKSYFHGWEYDPYSYEITTAEGNTPTLATLRGIARHFYELGLNAREK